MNKFERKLLILIEKKIFFISYIVITIFAILLRLTGFQLQSGDFTNFLLPWYEELKSSGGLNGMASYTGDYNSPYIFLLALLTYLPINPLFSIKLLSCFFDFIGAFFATLIVGHFNNNSKKNILSLATYAIVLFSPNVFLNSSYWGQCDFIYVSFLIMFLYFLITKKYVFALIGFGLALSFKLQAIFLLPFLLIYYMKNKEFSIIKLFIIPLTLIITGLPNVFFGHKSIFHFIIVYFRQTKNNGSLSNNFPNIWYWFPNAEKVAFSKVAIILTIIILGVMMVTIITNKKRTLLSEKDVITFSLWCVMTCVLFLPFMHERYGFFVDIVSIIYVLSFKKHWWIAIILNMISFFTYIDGLYALWSFDYRNFAFFYIGTYVLFSLYTLKNFYQEDTSLASPDSISLNPVN